MKRRYLAAASVLCLALSAGTVQAEHSGDAAAQKEENLDGIGEILEQELGDDLLSGMVLFDSHLYELPAPLSAFLENGFSIELEESDLELEAEKAGFVVLQKDNKKVKMMIENDTDQTAKAEECLVTCLWVSQYEDGFSLVLPGEIELGMKREDLEKILETFDVATEESDHFLAYWITSQDSDLNETSIFVEKETGIVAKIQIER
ncbi:MAG: hypothetical protein SO016_03335 [Lachnospiraceae bacterium]|nr:hypothetical protein [Lachnospiraceae bacterium]